VTDAAATRTAALASITNGSATGVGGSAGQTFTLTTGADTTLTGGTGSDSYVGQINADMGTGTTFTAGDLLNGGSGTDNVQISVAGASTAAVTSTAVTLSNVERVTVSNFDSNTNDAHDHEFNAALWTGVTHVGLGSSNSTGDTSFTNLKNLVTAEMSNGSADLSVTYLASVVTGTADTQNLTVSGVTVGATGDSGGNFIADAGIETLAVTTQTTNSALTAITAAGVTRMTVAGDKDLSIASALPTNIKTIDASASTGAVSVVIGTVDATITGGSGNDTVRISGATVDANDTINAGTGTDTVQLTAAVASSATGAKLAGFENLRTYFDLTGNAGGANAEALTISQTVSHVSGITDVGVSKMTYTDDNDTNADTGTTTATFSGMSASQTMSISGITSAGDANDNGAMTAAISFALTTDTNADSGSLTLGTATAAAVVAGANNAITLNVTASDYETLSITSQGASNAIGTLTAADAKTLTILGSKALTITTLTAASVNRLDASAATANVNIGAVTAASSITGGSGNDSLTGGGNNDSIDGGAGNDTLSGAGGADSILGGSGNDSITAGLGNDTIDGGDGDDTFVDAVADIDAAATEVNSVAGGAGNDTFTIADFSDLTSAATINGGDGNDTLLFSEANINYNFTTDTTILANVSNVERIAFSALDGSDTVTVNDGIISGGSITLEFVTGTTGANTVTAAAVLASTSQVNFTDLTGLASTYVIGNGKDNATMSDGNDTVTVSNNSFLSANDTIAGGSGSDTLSFTFDTASSNTLTAAQLGNVTGFETFSINNGTDGTAVNYVLSLTEAIVGAQVAAGNTFTVTRDVGDTGTTRIDASALSSNYAVSLTGGTGADTITGGAAADTLTGGAGADSLTGGAGNDTFGLAITTNDTITDFNFGTSTTSVDVLRITGVGAAAVAEGAIVGTSSSAAGDYGVLVLTDATYATVALAAAAANLVDNSSNETIILIYQNSLGVVTVGYDADSDTDGTAAETVIGSLSGLTITGVASLINAGDFSFVA